LAWVTKILCILHFTMLAGLHSRYDKDHASCLLTDE